MDASQKQIERIPQRAEKLVNKRLQNAGLPEKESREISNSIFKIKAQHSTQDKQHNTSDEPVSQHRLMTFEGNTGGFFLNHGLRFKQQWTGASDIEKIKTSIRKMDEPSAKLTADSSLYNNHGTELQNRLEAELRPQKGSNLALAFKAKSLFNLHEMRAELKAKKGVANHADISASASLSNKNDENSMWNIGIKWEKSTDKKPQFSGSLEYKTEF